MLPTCPFPSLGNKARHHAAREVRRHVSLDGVHPFVHTMSDLEDAASSRLQAESNQLDPRKEERRWNIKHQSKSAKWESSNALLFFAVTIPTLKVVVKDRLPIRVPQDEIGQSVPYTFRTALLAILSNHHTLLILFNTSKYRGCTIRITHYPANKAQP